MDAAAGRLARFVRRGSPQAVRRALPEALPWVAHLPEPDVERLLRELVSVAQSATSPEELAPVAVLLAQWRNTADGYAERALREVLTREPDGDQGPVPVPRS